MTVVADTSRSSVLQLDWRMENGLITVTPMDQSRFVIKVCCAVQTCSRADRVELFEKQFDVLLTFLAQWLEQRSHIAFAFLTQRKGISHSSWSGQIQNLTISLRIRSPIWITGSQTTRT